MTRLLLLADTHLPKRAKKLPGVVWEEVARADLVVHAGDWVDLALLDELEPRCSQLVGVHGNNDGADLRERLPDIASTTPEGLRLSVIHETGDAKGRENRCDGWFPDTDVLVFGHSHIPWDTVTSNGLRLLNPGSPTDRRRQPHASYMTAELDGGQLVDVALHELD